MYIYNDADYDVHCIVMQTMLETAMQYGRHSVSQFASTVRRKVISLRRKLITLRRKLITLRCTLKLVKFASHNFASHNFATQSYNIAT